MYVQWKTLIILGIAFWILLCLTDVLYDDYGSKKYIAIRDDDLSWMRDVPEEELIYTPASPKDGPIIEEGDRESGFSLGWTLVFWNCVVFLSSIVFCSVLRNGTMIVIKRYAARRRYLVSSGSSPEVITLAQKESVGSIATPENCDRDDTSSTFLAGASETEVEPTRDNETDQTPYGINDLNLARLLEKQRLMMHDEMLSAQTASLKEHAMLSRKLEAVLREKRELSKELAIAQKEKRAAKQELEELLGEKACFLKKLESANKQLKSTNKTRKLAFVKLEESQMTIVGLRKKLEEVLREKENLQRKIISLEEETDRLRMDARRGQRVTFDVEECEDSKEHALDKVDETEFSSNNTIGEMPKPPSVMIYETETDMRKIEMKIMALEKNLEKFSSRKLLPDTPLQLDILSSKEQSSQGSSPNYEEEEKVEEETEIDMLETEEISTEDQCTRVPEEVVYKEVFVRKMIDENTVATKDVATKTTSKKLEPERSKLPKRIWKHAFRDNSSSLYKIPEESCLNKNFKATKIDMSVPTKGNEGNSVMPTATNSCCSTTTSMLENESSSEDSGQVQSQPCGKRMVSSSPAFQKFLKALDR